MTEFNDLEVGRYRVEATVIFDAFLVEDNLATVDGDRLAGEIADAVEFHGPHLSETEEGDTFVAVDRKEPVVVLLRGLTPLSRSFTTEDVQDAVDGTEAWL